VYCLAASIPLFAGVRRALPASSLRGKRWQRRHIGLPVVKRCFMGQPSDTHGERILIARGRWRIAS
jgi:hypothetical protein